MHEKIPIPRQQSLFSSPTESPSRSKFISTYRVSLVRDRHLPFEQCRLSNSRQAQKIFRNLIETHGQSDREQFIVVLPNAKNENIGLNIVSIGAVTSAQVSAREVLKPAILANASAMILSHTHPSDDLNPSSEDIAVMTRIIQACEIIGIQVHEHLVTSMSSDRYYSFADAGIIKRIYDAMSSS